LADIVWLSFDWRFHLQVRDGKVILESMITEGNKQKRQSQTTLPLSYS